MKYKTPTGKKKWHESTIRGILKNEKYKGDVLQGKTYTTDPISHRRVVNMGEEKETLAENILLVADYIVVSVEVY